MTIFLPYKRRSAARSDAGQQVVALLLGYIYTTEITFREFSVVARPARYHNQGKLMSAYQKKPAIDGGRMLQFVRSAAISPANAMELVQNYERQVRRANPRMDNAKVSEAVANKIIARYAKFAGMVGGTSALAGVVPGIGTIVAATGGAMADAATCMKLQVDMCMCMAAAYGYDLNNEDAQHLSFLVAAGGTLEKAGVEATTRMASKAGVKLLRKYLQGAVLQAIKEMFKKLGIVFTRKALEKALPFGIGVVIGGTANYALTKYVGAQAREWFIIDASMHDED